MTNKRILFVDDEPDLLQGVRDALRRRRKIWDMSFVTSGQEALQVLQGPPYDLIVTDMRMPGMDGVELLAAVSDRYPAMSRVVLSGHAERSQLTRASGLAHQILSKPCDGLTLQTTIEGLLLAQDRASDERVRSLVGRVNSLPSVQWVLRELLAASRSPSCRIDELAAILEADPGLTARVLHLANSACFGDHERLHSVVAAIRYLGLEQVKALVMLAQTFQLLVGRAKSHPFDPESWQRHSLLCAGVARALCSEPDWADDAYVAGLLHDIGHVVFVLGCADQFADVQRLAVDQGMPEAEAERAALGLRHDEVGAHLLACWGFEPAVVSAVGQHHQRPEELAAGEPLTSTAAVMRATWAANQIVENIHELPAGEAAVRHWLCCRSGLPALQPAVESELLSLLSRHGAGPDAGAAPLKGDLHVGASA